MKTEDQKPSPIAGSHYIQRLRAEQFSNIIRHTPSLMLANICNATVFVAASWDRPYRYRAIAWATTIGAIASFVYLRRIIRRTHKAAASTPKRGVYRAVVYAAALGACWGALPLLFLEDATVGGKLLIACLCSGMLGGGAFALASMPSAAVGFSGPIAVGSLLALLRAGETDYLLTVIVLVVYSAVLLKTVWSYAEGLEQRIRTQMEAEGKASQRLDRLHASGLQALGGMASGLAHEIVQPLAAASAYVDASRRLVSKSAAEEVPLLERNLQAAAERIKHVGDIIARLRHFLLEGKPSLAPVGLHALIEEASRVNARALEEAQASLRLRLNAENDVVHADGVQIMQVLSNLLRNAADALAEAAERRIIVTCRNEDGSVRIDVADSGAGVAEGVRERLFDPFLTTKPRGMGVGLAMCRTIIEAHGGRIWMEPNSTGGATFSFVLPRANGTGESNGID